jgi:TolA-binding protein
MKRKWPNDPAVLVRLAAIQERDGAVDQALKTYEKLLADYPQFAPALRQLALRYGQRATADTGTYLKIADCCRSDINVE